MIYVLRLQMHNCTISHTIIMMTSSNGNISRVTGHLCKGQWRGVWWVFLIYAWINGWVNNREAGDLRRHLAHYDVTVMYDETRVYHCQTVALSAPLAWSSVTTHVKPSNSSCQKPQTVIPITSASVEFSPFFLTTQISLQCVRYMFAW